MERLNDNEVREVARMQQLIDAYEAFIGAIHIMIVSGKKIDYVEFTRDCPYHSQMNYIWKWVKQQKGIDNDK